MYTPTQDKDTICAEDNTFYVTPHYRMLFDMKVSGLLNEVGPIYRVIHFLPAIWQLCKGKGNDI